MPEISIVIPTLGRPSLQRTLELWALQTIPASHFELLAVADAGAADAAGVAQAIGRRPYATRALRGHAAGASAARNRGWREAASEVILFTGDDILPERSLLAQHLEWHRRWPEAEVGVLGRVTWARELRVTPFMRWLDQGPQFGYGSIAGAEARWWHFYTANVSVKREMLERAGGFDESFPFLFEDLDFAKRIERFGFRLLYNRDARAEHLHAASLKEWRSRIRSIAKAERRFVRKHADTEPYWFSQLAAAASDDAPRGRAVRFASLVPRRVPWLGSRVWESSKAFYRRQLAGPFLEEWEAAETREREGEH